MALCKPHFSGVLNLSPAKSSVGPPKDCSPTFRTCGLGAGLSWNTLNVTYFCPWEAQGLAGTSVGKEGGFLEEEGSVGWC